MDDRTADIDGLFVIYVHNRPGVLAKIAGTLHRRGMNIRSLTVAATHHPEQSKMVVRVAASQSELERIAAAIRNLVDVLSVALTDAAAAAAQELCLVRIAVADAAGRCALLAAAAPFQPRLVEADSDTVVLEVAGSPAAVERFMECAVRFRVVDVSRTGVTLLPGASAPSM